MRCERCGGETWSDDDLHWAWCENPKCLNSYGKDEERMNAYFQAIQEKEEYRKSRGYDDEYDTGWA
jgi:hypothetical protein